jgi:hypothetical protein
LELFTRGNFWYVRKWYANTDKYDVPTAYPATIPEEIVRENLNKGGGQFGNAKANVRRPDPYIANDGIEGGGQ